MAAKWFNPLDTNSNYDPQSAGINVQSPQSDSTPRRLTLNWSWNVNIMPDQISPLVIQCLMPAQSSQLCAEHGVDLQDSFRASQWNSSHTKARCVLLHSSTYYVYTTELLKGGCSWVGTVARHRRTMAPSHYTSRRGAVRGGLFYLHSIHCSALYWPYVTQGMPYGSQFWRHWQTYANSAGRNTVVHKRQKVMLVALAHPVDSMPATFEVNIFVLWGTFIIMQCFSLPAYISLNCPQRCLQDWQLS